MAEAWQENRGFRSLWMVLAGVVIASFGALLYYGREVYQMAPPVPERVVAPGGPVVFSGDDIRAGQDVWRSIGGHELGSIWGHGSYTAPDWTADWLHREAVWLLDRWAHEERERGYEDLDGERQAALRARLQHEMRTNTYDTATQTITVSELRAQAIHNVQAHYLGLFGFLINPPIALYYMQGLNTTPVHAHTALFGVYGMLGIGLSLLSLRLLTMRQEWNTTALGFAFWAMNIGMGLQVILSLLPVGLAQTWASVEHGMWYARSAEFLQTPVLDTFRWLRVIGDTIFAIGILAFGWFHLGLSTGWSVKGKRTDVSTPEV